MNEDNLDLSSDSFLSASENIHQTNIENNNSIISNNNNNNNNNNISQYQPSTWSYGRSNLLSYASLHAKSSQHVVFRHRTSKFEVLNKFAHENGCTPLPRSGHRIVSDEHYVYLFGGYNPQVAATARIPDEQQWNQTKPLLKELWRYSKLTQTWQYLSTGGTAPDELVSHSAFMLSPDQLLVYGGSGMPFGSSSSNKIYVCDLRKLYWSQIICENEIMVERNDIEQRNPDVPDPAYGQAIAYDKENQLMYCCGGTSGFDYSLSMHEFDFETKRWRLLSPTPQDIEPRYRHEMALYRRKLFVIGGGTSDQSFSMEKVPIFDLATNEWSLEPAKPWKSPEGQQLYPSPRYSHDIVQMDRMVYIIGGADQTQAFDDCWSIDLETLQWQKHPEASLPTPCYFHSATISEDGGELMVFGGVNCISRKRRSNAMYRCWLSVPSLQRLAMNAVVGYLQTNLATINDCNHTKHRSKIRKQEVTIGLLKDYFKFMDIQHKMLNLPEF